MGRVGRSRLLVGSLLFGRKRGVSLLAWLWPEESPVLLEVLYDCSGLCHVPCSLFELLPSFKMHVHRYGVSFLILRVAEVTVKKEIFLLVVLGVLPGTRGGGCRGHVCLLVALRDHGPAVELRPHVSFFEL